MLIAALPNTVTKRHRIEENVSPIFAISIVPIATLRRKMMSSSRRLRLKVSGYEGKIIVIFKDGEELPLF